MVMRTTLTVAACLLVLGTTPAVAQNREHLQMNADLRILQEQVSRLQLSVNRLDAQIAETNKRLDATTAASVKGFADQQLLINQLATTVATIRERLDDNTVRVSQLSQEFSAIREGVRRLTDQINALVGLLQPPVDPSAAPPTSGGAPSSPQTSAAPPSTTPPSDSAPPASTAQGPLSPVVLPQSASYVYQQAMADYGSQRYDSAIEGFRDVINDYPDSPVAADAQLMIGESFNSKKDCRSALPEYQKFVDNFPTSERRHEGLYMIGWCYADVGQRANAQRAYQEVIKEYPNEISAIQARQRLEAMGVKPQ